MRDGTFVFDAHTGFWDASPENTKNRFGDAFIETFYAFQTGFNPPDPKWTMDYERTFRKVDPDWFLEEMFVKGEADMAILSTQVLSDFYHTGFVNPERNAELVKRAPERLIALGGVDPRAPDALEQVEYQITELGMKGFKWYTAEWRGESRGWNANDPMVFPLYEKALELGVRNHFFHKGPAVEPLRLEKFDVRDIDEPAWLYPEMNLIIDHCGAPRVDDFCWIATRCPNVYAGLAVVLGMIEVRPQPEEQVRHDLGEPARPVVDEGEHHGQAGVDVGAAGGQPAEGLHPRGAAVVDDEVHLRVQPGRLVDVADVELGQRQWLHGRALVEEVVAHAQLQGLLVAREDHRVVRLPAA